jgi:hypothetical protein
MDDSEGRETMRERAGESRLVLWVLLDGNRFQVAGLLSLSFLLSLVVMGAVGPPTFREFMGEVNQVGTVFQAFVASLVTGVTLVVTIGQLVLSLELGSLGRHRERMSEAVEFRRDIDAVLGEAGPPEPAAALGALVDASTDRAAALVDAVSDDHDDLHRQVSRFEEQLVANAEAVSDRLEGVEFDEFEPLRAAMDYNHSWKLYAIHRLSTDHADDIDAAERRAFDEMTEVLLYFGPMRQHLKALYFQRELVLLVRSILGTAVVALPVAVGTLLYLEPSSFPGATAGVEHIVVVVATASAISLLPFFLLGSILLRITTTAKRTGAIGPFVVDESDVGDLGEEFDVR